MAQEYMPSFMAGKTEGDTSRGQKIQDIKDLQNKRTSFNETGSYRVDNLSYPIDLLSPSTSEKYPNKGNTEYGSNYVVFYINVNDGSKLLKDKNKWYGNQIVEDWSNSDKERLVGQNISQTQATTGSALEGVVTGGAIGTALKGDIKGAVGGAAFAGGLNIVGNNIIASQTANFSRQLKRLKAALALHTPNNLSARYSVNYEEASTSAFQMAMRGGEDLARAVGDMSTKGNVADETSEDVKAIASAIALNAVNGKDSISTITGLAINPKKEQIFRGVDFRTWQFDYQFFPRSKQEYQNVENIIYMFKLHMHPEYKDANNFLYIYPSEFDIVHYNGVDENLHLPRHTSCVLTDLSVNYAPQSQFTAFEGGIPTQINISLTFKELVQMSKERIQEGF